MAGGGRGKAGGKSIPPGKGSAAAKGPGKWKRKKPTTQSQRALEYQEQITGQPAWRVYEVDEVEFDGFDGLELKEAKGPGYDSFFNQDGTPKKWYADSNKFKELVKQAREQSRVAQQVGIPLRWYVADESVAVLLTKLFGEDDDIRATVIHQAAKP